MASRNFFFGARVPGPPTGSEVELPPHVNLPDLNGLELQERIAEQVKMPIIFITHHGDVAVTVKSDEFWSDRIFD